MLRCQVVRGFALDAAFVCSYWAWAETTWVCAKSSCERSCCTVCCLAVTAGSDLIHWSTVTKLFGQQWFNAMKVVWSGKPIPRWRCRVLLRGRDIGLGFTDRGGGAIDVRGSTVCIGPRGPHGAYLRRRWCDASYDNLLSSRPDQTLLSLPRIGRDAGRSRTRARPLYENWLSCTAKLSDGPSTWGAMR